MALLDQLRLLPEDIATALPMSHHRLLVHVPDEKKRIALAKKAATKGLSKRELAAEIKKGKKSDGRGRPALPTFQKTLNLFQRVLSADDAFEDLDQIDEMDADQAKELHDTVLTIKAKCQEIQDKLQPRIPGFEYGTRRARLRAHEEAGRADNSWQDPALE